MEKNMTTVGKLKRVLVDFAFKADAHNLSHKKQAEILIPFHHLAEEFENSFGQSILELDRLPEDRPINGQTLVKIRDWVDCLKRTVGWDYSFWCGLSNRPSSLPPDIEPAIPAPKPRPRRRTRSKRPTE